MADAKQQDKPAERATDKQSEGEKPEPATSTSNPTAADRSVRSRGTTSAQAEELAKLGVNPRLDNRTGDQRPIADEWPAKPQQIPGPEVGHFAEHASKLRDKHPEWFADAAAEPPAGMRSEGPHGLGPEDA